MKFFENADIKDLEQCILGLENEEVRQNFEIAFRKFSQYMDIVLPDPYANKYLHDLNYLGKKLVCQ